ncbi:putative beta-lactamase-like 1 [Oscarella lobularis]|uniref:putative beta-lactamase-like 1 n=1 Tax=Oscarella lobularis TaxID=121494 RepID=UPI0033134BDB
MHRVFGFFLFVLVCHIESDTPTSENCPAQYLPEDFTTLPPVLAQALRDFQQLLASQLNSTSLPGIGFAITYRGKAIFDGGLGVLNKKTTKSPSSFTIFRLGSVTKVFVAIMAYQMMERGQIKSLDDPFQVYAPDFDVKNPFGNSKITIRQMLSQLSGLPREAPCLYGSISTCNSTTAEIYDNLKNESLIFPPWVVPSYSNLGFALLGNGLAAYLNTTFEDYVQKNILEPLNMGQTGFTFTSSVTKEMATGYNVDGTIAPLTNLNWLSPAGQMYSSPRAMAILMGLFTSGYDVNLINDSSTPDAYAKVLSPETVRQMSLPVYLNADGVTMFGTPWEMRYQNNYTVCSKGGNVLGYSTLFSFVSQLKLGVTVFWSGAIDELNASAQIYNILLPALTSALAQNQPDIGYPTNAPMYGGTYKASIGPLEAQISVIEEFKHVVISLLGINTYLWFNSATEAKVFIPPDLQSCMITELEAYQFERVYFSLDASGSKVLSFTFPGLVYGTSFVRV